MISSMTLDQTLLRNPEVECPHLQTPHFVYVWWGSLTPKQKAPLAIVGQSQHQIYGQNVDELKRVGQSTATQMKQRQEVKGRTPAEGQTQK